MAALLVGGALTTAGPAIATLSRVGPVEPVGSTSEGFPSWYADSTGLTLEMCLDGPPYCLVAANDMVPVHQADGDAEAFYSNVEAEVGPITVTNALEAAYAEPGPGQEMVFVRNQISSRDGVLPPGAVYKVTDPYGTLRDCVADAAGEIRNNACRTETVVGVQDFEGALNGRLGPFLTWDTYGAPELGTPPPAGYIGDNATPHKVVGSPTGFNKTRVTGPGINANLSQTCAADWTGAARDCAETDLFVVQGKVHPGPSARLSTARLAFGSVGSAVTQSFFTYTSTGSVDVTVGTVTRSGSADFAIAADTCTGATLAAGDSCRVDVAYTRRAGTSAAGSIVVTDSTVGSPRTVVLTGSSVAPPIVKPTPRERVAPKVSSHSPVANARVRRNANVTVTFSEKVTGWGARTVKMQRMSSRGKVVSTVRGTLTFSTTARRGTFNPFGRAAKKLVSSTRYRVQLSAGIRDAAGNPLKATSWTFKTGKR